MYRFKNYTVSDLKATVRGFDPVRQVTTGPTAKDEARLELVARTGVASAARV